LGRFGKNLLSETVVIELPGPPQGKGRPRFVVHRSGRFGHAYTPPETRAYESALQKQASVTMGWRKPLTGPLSVYVEAWFPIPASWSRRQFDRAVAGAILPTGRPDADNLLKMLDGLNGIVWTDDRQIVTATIKKRYSTKPALVIRVTEESVSGKLFESSVEELSDSPIRFDTIGRAARGADRN
jgi:Holliday junction resolvase RusA-like endonuclease